MDVVTRWRRGQEKEEMAAVKRFKKRCEVGCVGDVTVEINLRFCPSEAVC